MLTDSFNFTVENDGTIEAYYQIYIDDQPLEPGENRIPGTNIRYELKKEDIQYNISNLSETATSLYMGNIEPDVIDSFELRLWVDYDTTTVELNSVHRSKLRIEASQESIATDASCFTFAAGTITDYDENCPNDVIIPETISGTKVTSIGDGAFKSSVQITGGIVENEHGTLNSVIIPNTVTSIGREAFRYNVIKKVELSNSIFSIDDYAFSDNQLTEVVIPKSVTTIESFAFSNNLLPNITLTNTINSFGFGIVFGNPLCDDVFANVTIIGSHNYKIDRLCTEGW